MDDAALSCGRLLSARPSSHVVTIFSGGPASVRPLPTWDQMSGSFKPGDNVMALRQVEDEDAMAVVAAHGHRLDFWDEQYRAGRPIRLARLRPRALSAARARLDDPALGELRRTEAPWDCRRDGARDMADTSGLVARRPQDGSQSLPAGCPPQARTALGLYEELPYRLEVPLEVTAAKQRIQANGFGIRPNDFASSGDTSKKARHGQRVPLSNPVPWQSGRHSC